MPLTHCEVDGKSGFRWGQQGKCYTGPDGKKKAIKQGVAVEGPKKFGDIMKHEKGQLIDYEGLSLARQIMREEYPRGYVSQFTEAVGNYLASKGGVNPVGDSIADDGQNDSDKPVDIKEDENTESDRTGNFSMDGYRAKGPSMNNPLYAGGEETKDPDGDKEEDEKVFALSPNPHPTTLGTHIGPTQPQSSSGDKEKDDKEFSYSSLDWDIHSTKPPTTEPAEQQEDECKEFTNFSLHSESGSDEERRFGDKNLSMEAGEPARDKEKDNKRFSMEPSDAIDDSLPAGAALDSNDEVEPGGLDVKTHKPAFNLVVPPYNKEASPESDPTKPVPNYEPPTRDEMTPKANLYHDDDDNKEAAEATLLVHPRGISKSLSFVFPVPNDRGAEDPHFADKDRKAFEVHTQEDLDHSIRNMHHADNPTNVKKNLIRIAKQKGLRLPPHWSKDTASYANWSHDEHEAEGDESMRDKPELDFVENAGNQPSSEITH